MTSALRIIVTGLIGHYPLGGMTWHYLQYVLGLARLGHDVYYLEDMGAPPYNPADGGLAKDCAFNVRYLSKVMSRFGLGDRWAYCFSPDQQWYGLAEQERLAVIRSADLLINVSGTLSRPLAYRQVRRLAYIDTDPVFNQIKLARGDADFREQVDAHDVHFSFGERLGDAVPATGHCWLPTRQPIVLSEWHPSAPRRWVFTTIMNWTMRYKPVVHEGREYGQKDVEFLRFIDLPRRVDPTVLEIALNVGKKRQAPLGLLTSRGWRIVDPGMVCGDLDNYRRFIESSAAEWSVAKNGYFQGQPGWFSERSACYLAAGRPVVVQDTGFPALLPVGEGILPFRTPDEAVAAIQEVEGNYACHASAARAIAEAYFDSDKVLNRLVEEALGSEGGNRSSEPATDVRERRRRCDSVENNLRRRSSVAQAGPSTADGRAPMTFALLNQLAIVFDSHFLSDFAFSLVKGLHKCNL